MPVKKNLKTTDQTAEEQSLEQQAIAAFEQELEAEAEAEEAEEAAKPADKKQFITKEIVIDKYNVKRVRIPLTPAVCDKCGFDVAARNGLGDYEQMSEQLKAQVAAAIKEHKDIVHTIATDLIVDEDEVPTEWLGQHKKF
jgi:predicted Zn-ribbon and HTH transcriptional regulator